MPRMRRASRSGFVALSGLTVLAAAAGTVPSCPGLLEPVHGVVVSMEGQGNVTLSPAGGVYVQGDQVQAIAVPDSGWQFDHWEGACSGSGNPCGLTVDSDLSVLAVFAPAPYTLTIKTVDLNGQLVADGAGARRMLPRHPDEAAYRFGGIVTVEPAAVPVADLLGRLWLFDHWVDPGEGQVSADGRVLTINMTGSDANKTATAALKPTSQPTSSTAP